MNSTFQNQLTNAEIQEGVSIYVRRRASYFAVLFLVAIWMLLVISGASIVAATFVSVVVALLASVGIATLIMRQFSPDKIATYKLHDTTLEIVNSNGAVHRYDYSNIKSVAGKDVFALLLPQSGFAIVAKRNRTAEQMRNFAAFN